MACVLGRLSARCRMEVLDLWFLAAWRAQVRPRACDVAGASGQSTRMCAGLAPRFVGLNEASPSSWKRALPDGDVFGAIAVSYCLRFSLFVVMCMSPPRVCLSFRLRRCLSQDGNACSLVSRRLVCPSAPACLRRSWRKRPDCTRVRGEAGDSRDSRPQIR